MTDAMAHQIVWLLSTVAALGCALALAKFGAGLMRVSLEGATSITSKYGRGWLLICCLPGSVVLGFGIWLLWILVTAVAGLKP